MYGEVGERSESANPCWTRNKTGPAYLRSATVSLSSPCCAIWEVDSVVYHCLGPLTLTVLLLYRLMQTMFISSSPVRRAFTVCRTPWLFMKRHHLKPCWWDSGGIKQFPVSQEDLNGARRDWKCWESWAVRSFKRRTGRELRRKCELGCLNGNATPVVL